jgi:hypothetical protein
MFSETSNYKIINFKNKIIEPKSGMFSGSRTTMRDNTLLNYAYITMAQEMVNFESTKTATIRQKWICGDDCDLFFDDQKNAL